MYSFVNRSFGQLRCYNNILFLQGENWSRFDNRNVLRESVCFLFSKNSSSIKPAKDYKISNKIEKVNFKLIRAMSTYYPANETGLEGPDQILKSNVDTTWKPDGRVRIILENDSDEKPISVPGLFARTVRKYPDRLALISQPDADGNRTILSYRDYEIQVRTVAKAFLHLGLERHHSVCILGSNSHHWIISDLAAIYAGGFAAGIYTTNSAEACHYCAETSRANIIVVEDDKQLQKILKIKNKLPKLKAIIQYDGNPKADGVLSWNEVLKMGQKQTDEQLDQVLKTIGANECCTLVYTSGTTGNPKVVMLSHDNLIANARAIQTTSNSKEAQEVMISFLPLCHIAAQILDIYVGIGLAATLYIADKNALKGSLLNNMLEVRPTLFIGVPRVWEKIHEKMQTEIQNAGPVQSWLIRWAGNQGLKYNMNRMYGKESTSISYKIAKFLVIDKLKKSLGLDKSHFLMTGAAPFSTDFKKDFMSFDVLIMDIYGMCECAGGHSCATDRHYRLDSIGRTMPGFTTKLDNVDSNGEGEICMSGRHVLMGYLNNPEKTKEAKGEDNWLHTGDLGKIDADGFLYITGRIKELVITAGGENIAPVQIEHFVREECPAISNCIVVGDRRKYLTMLVALKTRMNGETGAPLDNFSEETLSWAHSLGSSSTSVTEVINTQDSAIYKAITDAISRANEKAMSNAHRVQKFRILPHDFSLPTGELGPTLKLKRNVVLTKYGDLIDDMYK